MPIYEFLSPAKGKIYSFFARTSDYADKIPLCHDGKQYKMTKLLSGFSITGQISDAEFLEGIAFLFEKEVVSVSEREVLSESQWTIPQWVKNSAGWWYEEKISDDEFLNIVENLVKRQIIIV